MISSCLEKQVLDDLRGKFGLYFAVMNQKTDWLGSLRRATYCQYGNGPT